jgi:hypothetical protein
MRGRASRRMSPSCTGRLMPAPSPDLTWHSGCRSDAATSVPQPAWRSSNDASTTRPHAGGSWTS